MQSSLIKKVFSRKIQQESNSHEIERKSHSNYFQYSGFGPAINDALSAVLCGEVKMTPQRCIDYYEQIAPVSNAVEMIASEVEGLKPYIWDGAEYTRDSELIKLLDHPMMNDTSAEFLGAICRQYTITKNCFIVANGPLNKPPKELDVIPVQNITTRVSDRDGKLEEIVVNNGSYGAEQTFMRQIPKGGPLNGKERFISTSGTSEIWPITGFSPDKVRTAGLGVPDLTAVLYEILQFFNSNVHNAAMLKNGASIMGILSIKDATIDKMDQLKEQFNRSYSGATNANKTLVTNGEVDFKNLSMSLKDMDFIQLKKNVERIIYNKFRIPLPLVLEDSMTLDNMRQAKSNLYYFAVLPKIDLIFKQLTLFLGPRFGLKDNQVLTYKSDEIPVLRRDAIDETLILQQTGVFSDNELRARLGYGAYADGDIIYKPSNLIPAGEDANTQDNVDNATEKSAAAKKPFSEYMIEAESKSKMNGHDKSWSN